MENKKKKGRRRRRRRRKKKKPSLRYGTMTMSMDLWIFVWILLWISMIFGMAYLDFLYRYMFVGYGLWVVRNLTLE